MFHRSISVREKIGSDVIEFLIWKNMDFKLVFKWDWYFQYRAALLQVKYPKYRVEYDRWSTTAEGRTLQRIELDKKTKRITVCKRMITKCKNSIESYRLEQNSLLIPNWNNERYLKTIDKFNEYSKELNLLNSELIELQKALA